MGMIKFLNNKTCCEDDQSNGGNGDKNCLTQWEEQLTDASNDYSEKSAESEKAKEKYDNSYNWRDKLTKWLDLIEKSNEKADNIVIELEFFYGQVIEVCKNAECTSKALEKLLCQVKSIFDLLYTYENGEDQLKALIAKLIKEINCVKDVKDQDKETAINCVKVYEEKIKMVCELQDDLLCKLIDALKCANLLFAYICDEQGLRFKLKKILDEFNGSIKEEASCSSDDDDSESYPCDAQAKKPQPTMPIDKSDYFKNTKSSLDIAIVKTDKFKEDWTKKKKKSDDALSRKNSLAEAIKAAKAAEGK
ncbi:hypothetical protein [uncultured Psychroserpens sp.]|uniref:hypothetical protein n=1 Tax=uncultured Psychroserpens sp. TaxID=255436 RepID=UPI002627D176|nr:hypothetical protein [uncultured Psychroserpens sp.]